MCILFLMKILIFSPNNLKLLILSSALKSFALYIKAMCNFTITSCCLSVICITMNNILGYDCTVLSKKIIKHYQTKMFNTIM